MSTVTLVLLFAAAVVAASWWITGRLSVPLEQMARDDGEHPLRIERTESGVDLGGLSLPVAVRGYRMAEVDAVLQELVGIIAQQAGQNAACTCGSAHVESMGSASVAARSGAEAATGAAAAGGTSQEADGDSAAGTGGIQ